MASSGECWFCGRVADPRQAYRVALHRNVEVTHYVIVAREEWERRDLKVPRCRRCRVGHGVETLLLLGGVAAFPWGMALLLDGLTGAAGADPLDRGTVAAIVAFSLPFAGWVAVVLGAPGLRGWFPHRRRYVRQHPVVAELLSDGWRYGGAPIGNFDKRWIWPD